MTTVASTRNTTTTCKISFATKTEKCIKITTVQKCSPVEKRVHSIFSKWLHLLGPKWTYVDFYAANSNGNEE